MNLINRPLRRNDQGTEVKNLQYILFFLVQKINNPGLNNFFNRPDFKEQYKNEVFQQMYGSATSKLVDFLQELLRGRDVERGVVDNPTVEKFNELLREFRGLEIEKPQNYPFEVSDENNTNKFTITGTVTDTEKNGLAAITVIASEYDIDTITKIGESAPTDEKGNFSISFTYNLALQEGDAKTNPDILFRLFDRSQQELAVSAIFIPGTQEETAAEKLSDAAQAPIVLMNTPDKISLRIVPVLQQRPLTEFEKMILLLNPYMRRVGFADLKEDNSNFQISFLSKESGVSKLIIQLLKNAFVTERSTRLPAWAFFGLDRQSFNYAGSKSVSINEMAALLKPLQPASSQDDLNVLAGKLLEYAKEKTASETAASLKISVGGLVNPILQSPEKLDTLLDAYARFEGEDITKFWDAMSENPALTEAVPKVQFSLQLAQLTFNNAALMNGLHTRFDTTKDLVQLEPDEWLHLVLEHKETIPPHIEGETADEKAKNYAQGIQQFLEVSFPHEYITKSLSREPVIGLPLLRRVARLNPGVDLVNDTAAPLSFTGLSEDQKKEVQASLTKLQAEALAYPGYAHALARNNVLKNTDIVHFPNTIRRDVGTFFTNNKSFDIIKTPYDQYIKGKTDEAWTGIENRQVVADQVRSMQRIHTVTAGTTDMNLLLNKGFHSAFQISRVSPDLFVEGMADSMSSETAMLYHQKASKVTATTTFVYHQFYELGKGVKPGSGPSPGDSDGDGVADSADPVKQMPEWEELFGSLDNCQCCDCLSVYSPAAYFVDMLNIKNGFVKNKNAYKVMFARRVDLRYIKLSCENTNTLIPYIDLVNEILETYIANGALAEKTTIDTSDFTADELAANPQHPANPKFPINYAQQAFDDAYTILKNAPYPAGLPFDLPLETAREFLQEMGSSRYEVMKTFQKDEKLETLIGIEVEERAISEKEFEVITGSRFDGFASNIIQFEYEYYGYTESDIMPVLALKSSGHGVEILQKKLNLLGAAPTLAVTGVFDPLTETALKKFQHSMAFPESGATDKNNWSFLFTKDNFAGEYLAYVKEFLDRTAIQYTDLIKLLETQFLNPDKNIILALVVPDGIADVAVWQSAHACDLNFTRLVHMDLTVLDNDELSRFARFIRLWKKTGISIRDLDIVMTGLSLHDVSADLLWQLSKIIRLSEELNIAFGQSASLWSNIPTWGEKSLYEQLFLNQAALQNDPIFLLDPSQKQLANTTKFISDYIPSLLAAFKIKEAELDLLLKAGKISSSGNLTIEVISAIYRHVLLARAAKLSMVDFCALLRLSGASPWGNVFSVLSFMELANKCKRSGLNIPQLSYIYLHDINAAGNYLPTTGAVLAIAQTLRAGLLQIEENSAVKDGVVNEEFLKNQVGAIFDSEQAGDLLAALKSNTVYTENLSKLPFSSFDAFLGLVHQANKDLVSRLTYDDTKKQLSFQGAMTDGEQAALQGLSGAADYNKAIIELGQQPRETLAHVLSGFLTAAFIKSLVNTHAADADKFKLVYDALLPFIKKSQQDTFLKQQISNLFKTDATIVDTLISISQKYWGNKLRSDVLALSDTGLWGTYLDNTNTVRIQQVDLQINKNWGLGSENNALIAADGFKVVWTGKIAAPKTEIFTFSVEKDSDATVELSINGRLLNWVVQTPGEWTSEAVSFKTGELNNIALTYTEASNEAKVALHWSSKTVPRVLIPTESLYPSRPLENFYLLYVLLQKITLLTNALKLGTEELMYFSDNKNDFSGFDLDLLPVEEPLPYLPDAFNQFLRLVDYTTFRNGLQGGENGPVDIFRTAKAAFQFGESVKLLPPSAAIDKQKNALYDQLVEKIIQVTNWDKAELQNLVGNAIIPLVAAFNFTGGYFEAHPADFVNESFLLRIATCLGLAEKIGVSAAKIGEWVSSPTGFAQVQDIKRTLRAKFKEPEWADVSKSVNNRLRVKQRDALVAYILTLPAIKAANIKDTNGLYSFFLIDVEMDACMLTSRIKQAISSVQLFIQRCLMNLESNVLPAEINVSDWKWMKNYRVWEANRKVFLYPENWIEPELRDNKSQFFKELESELLQNEVTNDNVEKALMNYLEKLDDVAKLDICGMYEDEEAREVHVFGRTVNMASIYYYRKLNQQSNVWTAWEKVQLDIKGKEDDNDTGVHLIPVVWNRRLHLFWPSFEEVDDPDKASGNEELDTDVFKEIRSALDIDKKRMWKINFSWSEYRNEKWLPKKSTKPFIYSKSIFEFTQKSGFVKILGSFIMYLPKQSEHYFEVDQSGSDLVINVYRKLTHIQGIEFVQEGYKQPVKIEKTDEPYPSRFSERIGTAIFTGCHHHADLLPAGGLAYADLLVPDNMIKTYQGFTSINKNKVSYLGFSGTGPWLLLLNGSNGIYQTLTSSIETKKIYYNFFYEDKSRTYYVTSEGYMQMENYSQKNQADFQVVANAKQMESVKIVSEKRLASHSQIANAAVLNPALLGRSSSAVAATTNNLKLINSSSPAKEAMEYSFEEYKLPGKTKFTFHTHYHGYVCEFMKALNKGGIDELLTLQNQSFMDYMVDLLVVGNGFEMIYHPEAKNVSSPYPFTHVEFERDAAYGLYNWELFFHIPMLIANRLSKNQRFEEAKRWYEFVFNPTSNQPGNSSTRYWNVIPFMQTPIETIQELMNKLRSSDSGQRDEIQAAIEAWRNDPFNPHLIARMRLIAYMKNTVMKYLDNLIAWGDQLFMRDTIESINEATQLYIMAAEILGRYPQKIPARGEIKPKSFDELEPTLDTFSNSLVKMETMFPFFNAGPISSSSSLPSAVTPSAYALYFCIPDNDKLLGYWDLVADRLFKIRHCQNIEGVERQLALFEPPIDPALLVQAVANGIDINTVLNDINAPLPYYRFTYFMERALQMCGSLISIGTIYLSALEKRDGEELSMLKATQETAMLGLIKEMKQLQIQESNRNREGLEKTKEVTQARYDYYAGLINTGLIENEKESLEKLAMAKEMQDDASTYEIISNLAHLIPDISFSITVPPKSVSLGTSYGGSNIGSSYAALGRFINSLASGYTYEANRGSTTGANERRATEWIFQKNIASKELVQIDKQILASQIRENMATKDLSNQEQLIENAQRTEEFLRNKFTNQELYGHMIGDIATCFFPFYQMAYQLGKTAERACAFELGIPSPNIIKFGYWDSFRKGLMAGEKLLLALKQLEKFYFEQNKRDYEITKHISLLQFNPLALLALKETGSCIIELPEYLFDMDYPGQYMRKIKQVSLSIPCVAGPYTSINCTLTLLKSKIRVKNIPTANAYTEQEEEDHFETRLSATNSIATSHAQNDTGMFELNFRDERLLPFESAGAIGSWEIKLPKETNQFDTGTISDLIIHLKYTAREGGKAMAKLALDKAKDRLANGLRLFSLKHEFINEWHAFLNPPTPTSNQVLQLNIDPNRFPWPASNVNFTISDIILFVDSGLASIPQLSLTSPGNTTKQYKFSKVPDKYGSLFAGHASANWGNELTGTWTLINPATNANKLNENNCNDIIALVNYAI